MKAWFTLESPLLGLSTYRSEAAPVASLAGTYPFGIPPARAPENPRSAALGTVSGTHANPIATSSTSEPRERGHRRGDPRSMLRRPAPEEPSARATPAAWRPSWRSLSTSDSEVVRSMSRDSRVRWSRQRDVSNQLAAAHTPPFQHTSTAPGE